MAPLYTSLRLGLVPVLSLCFWSGAGAIADSKVVTVVHANEEDQLLQAAFYQATRRGVGMQYAADVMRGLNDYVDKRTGSGKTAAVCVDMVVAVLATAHLAKWAAADCSRLLLQLQAELDADGPAAALEHARSMIGMIRRGNTADQILERTRRAVR